MRTSRNEHRDLKAPTRSAWLSGQTSLRAVKEFRALGRAVDGTFSIAPER